jgi:hypothetical protein
MKGSKQAESNKSGKEALQMQGRFILPSTGEEVEVYRPEGMTYPVDARVKWLTPGEGREALNTLLSEMIILEFDHLARAVVDGSKYRIDPLQELGQREGGWLETRLETDPERYDLIRDNENLHHRGKRLDLLLAAELTLRCSLKGFEGQKTPPNWVVRARKVYADLRYCQLSEAEEIKM